VILPREVASGLIWLPARWYPATLLPVQSQAQAATHPDTPAFLESPANRVAFPAIEKQVLIPHLS
jgi:hypothetical protein